MALETYAIPERAITTFETLHRLHVTVHDLHGSLWPHLKADRVRHHAPVCQAIKLGGGEARCVAFEVTALRQRLAQIPHGRVHVCHAGLVEWVVPVFSDRESMWTLFAGPRLPGPDLVPAAIDPPSRSRPGRGFKLERVDRAEAELILEHLRQLAARLKAWAIEEVAPSAAAGRPTYTVDETTKRRVVIQRFVAANHHRAVTLREMAAALGTSESRASHVVRELCGRSFQNLIADARLNTAMNLLRGTALSVMAVAVRSGFSEVNHFHRLFRARLGTTPRRYRAGGDA